MEYSSRARLFLAAHFMEPEYVDMEAAVSAFITDMQLGLAGRSSSLKMLPTYLTADGGLPHGVPAAVIDAGGTNFRTARVSFGEDGPVIEDLDVTRMPGVSAPVGWDELIDFTARRVLPVALRADTVGFCFSYPTAMTPDRDGRVISLTKQVRIEGFEGRLICSDLKARLLELGAGEKNVVLLNDTPAVLLSGASALRRGEYDGLVGLISGTGTNTCCSVPVSSVKSLGAGCRGNMLINLESGGFMALPHGDFDDLLDAATVDPGTYRHEKMTSGAYDGELCRLTLRAAAGEGLFTPAGEKAVMSLGALPTPTADAIAADSCGRALLSDREDMAMASELCRAVFDRAARCVCANLSAILTLTNRGESPDMPACICADGSLFKKSKCFRPALEGYMRDFTAGSLARYAVFYTTENATLLGSAAAALLNM